MDYLHAENDYTKKKLESTETLQKELFDEIVAKIVKDDTSVPYESNGYSIDASFSISRLSLLDRGFVFAIAHIRGGEELGRAWYEDGKLLTKMNTFKDFIACSEYLIEEGYSSEEKLFAQGGSAGGMLMGGIVNMRPELYKGVVAQVPFVDVVTTMLDDTIPLTTGEYDEWGNPNDKVFYDYMLAYFKYDIELLIYVSESILLEKSKALTTFKLFSK
jgi:oligopeptidase B